MQDAGIFQRFHQLFDGGLIFAGELRQRQRIFRRRVRHHNGDESARPATPERWRRFR